MFISLYMGYECIIIIVFAEWCNRLRILSFVEQKLTIYTIYVSHRIVYKRRKRGAVYRHVCFHIISVDKLTKKTFKCTPHLIIQLSFVCAVIETF